MYAWQSIPIIIINRNRLGALRSLLEWAIRIGCRDIRVLDSNSDYPPLLNFYAGLPKSISLLQLSTNAGPWAFWQLGIHKTIPSPYIVTDSDLVPSHGCPDDLVSRLVEVLERYPDCGKVGPGLRIDNLPAHYGQASIAYRWETQFWHRPLARGLYAAPIDTTFALYPEGSEFNRSQANIRLGHPYLFDHTPWYVNEESLGDEEKHYRQHTDQNYSNWSTDQASSRIAKKKFVKDFENRKRILHISRDAVGVPGWTSLSLDGAASDIRFAPDRFAREGLPLESDSVDGFYALDPFRSVPNPHVLMDELYRVGKSGAILHARLRPDSDFGATSTDCIKSMFQCFSQPAVWSGKFGYSADWHVNVVTVITDAVSGSEEVSVAHLMELLIENRVRDVIVELSVVKPSRSRFLGLPRRKAKARAASDDRFVPSFCR